MAILSLEELEVRATQSNKKISDIVLQDSSLQMECSEEEILKKLEEQYRVMITSIDKGLEKDRKTLSGLFGGNAYRVKTLQDRGKSLCGSFLNSVIYKALAIAEYNACMGKIVAAPTAGSCGILPACLHTAEEHFGFSRDIVIAAMLNASGIGMVIAKKASLAGASGGCQAECGSASAMTASALTEMMGGTPKQCLNACAFALKSLLGLVCDPVAGLVEEPCIIRNASSAVVAISACEMALANMNSVIPADEVIEAMDSISKLMPYSLKETAKGGLAVTKTGLEIQKTGLS